MTIAEFLLARIADDEAVARAAGNEFRLDDTSRPPRGGVGYLFPDAYVRIDPARVLAECEAKRRIVEEHSAPDNYPDPSCSGDDWTVKPEDCATLAALASVYADHPDYQQEWR